MSASNVFSIVELKLEIFFTILQYAACIEPRKTTNVCHNYDEIDLKNCHPSDIINGFKEVQRKGSDLEDYIDPENGLLHRLSNQAIIDYADIVKIFGKKNNLISH